NSGQLHVLSATVNNIPTDGRTIYVTLYSLVNNSWIFNHYTYAAFNSAVTPTPTPTPTVPPAGDQSMAWQNNAQHDGNDPSSVLSPPLTLKWKQDLTSAGVQSISYPL